MLKRTVLPVILAATWISVSEFVRNEILLKDHWTEHYNSMGLTFPSEPVNGAIWGLWSLLFAIGIYLISRKYGLLMTTFMAWFFAFLMMWVVVGNMAVLPYSILIYAVPLSLLESFLAAWIIFKLSK